MNWHELPELPKPNTAVMAEVRGKNIILKYVTGSIWLDEEKQTFVIPKVKRWAYIEEE